MNCIAFRFAIVQGDVLFRHAVPNIQDQHLLNIKEQQLAGPIYDKRKIENPYPR